jgi:AbiV family abortive infection protein
VDSELYRNREAALECMANAERLHEDAKLLLVKNRFPSAAALSVIGLEEVGKGLILALIPMGLSNKTSDLLNYHNFKEYYSMICVVCAGLITELLTELQTEYEATITDEEWVIEFIENLFRDESYKRILVTTELSLEKIRKAIDAAIDDIYFDDFSGNKGWNKNKIKQASLYVDIAKDGSIRTPLSMTKDECEECVNEFGFSLKVLSRLMRVMHSEKKWAEIADAIKRRE